MLNTIKVPLPLRSDAYTVSGPTFAGARPTKSSVYHLTNRYSPVFIKELEPLWPESSMILYGLSDFIAEHLLTPITHKDVDESVKFMESAHSFGGPLNFPEKLWRRVVDECGGYLPIKIEALPEGSAFSVGEPYVQVIAENGFGELAAHIEPLLVGMVSCATARATISRAWLNRIENMNLEINGDTNRFFSRFMIHDFGMRASSTARESEIFGRAHLLSFFGTDTFNAAYQAIEMGAKRPTGTSIIALAHRIVQGHLTEEQAFNQIHEAAKLSNVNIASYVADCYDFKNALKLLVKLAQANKESTVVVRPDSGDHVQNVIDIVTAAKNAGLFKKNGHLVEMTTLRFIQGDAINPEKFNQILVALTKAGFSKTSCGIFGVGGFLRNTSTRDLFSSAYKLAEADGFPVCKFSEVQGKRSIPGRVRLTRNSNYSAYSVHPYNPDLETDYVSFYELVHGEPRVRKESFDILQERALHEYGNTSKFSQEDSWSNEILDLQEKISKENRS